jgi:hypothetical protein
MSSAAPAASLTSDDSIFHRTQQGDAESGDVVLGTDTGVIDLPRQRRVRIAHHVQGRDGVLMANATGQIRLRGDFDPVAGTTSGDYLGTVCTAN